jgi:hypothetical protein
VRAAGRGLPASIQLMQYRNLFDRGRAGFNLPAWIIHPVS